MKNKFRACWIIVLIFSLTVIACNSGTDHAASDRQSADWVRIGKTVTGDNYYDKNSLKEENKNIIRVKTKAIYSENGKKEKLAFLKSINKAPASADSLSHEIRIWNVDCVNKKINPYSSTIYGKGDQMITSSPEFANQWDDILPRSLSEKIKNVACNDSKEK